ncbi:MAG: VWA domain-containing protein [Verrucomicrobiales bacterium]|nr:VWA domain-containing protein [Verrucomicrobiales bacterium]
MDWLYPKLLLLVVPAVVLLLWFDARSTHPMSMFRRRMLLVVRLLLVVLAVLALASPARVERSDRQAAVLVMDHSQSQGEAGLRKVYEESRRLSEALPSGVQVAYVAAGSKAEVLAYPEAGGESPVLEEHADLMETIGAESNFADALRLAGGIFPSGVARHIVIVGDGLETSGSLEHLAQEAAISGVKIHALAVAGAVRPDVRVSKLVSSQARLNEGAGLELRATVESSLAGKGQLRLFENGLQVESVPIEVEVGQSQVISFQRSPAKRNIYNYRVVVEGFEAEDAIPENNEALSIVDVRGKPLLLYVEGEEGEASYLYNAMDKEGIRLDVRSPEGMPESLQDLAGYDGIIVSDVSAHKLGEQRMAAIRDYVEKLGGGFVMIGGMNSFGVGGYYRTPIEEILPVKLKAPDQEEFRSSALALVVDRSGSMSGQKIEICKSAAIATAELLTSKDYIGVYAFDSAVHVVVPMTRVSSTSTIANQISMLSAGGGTNIYPGMVAGREALNKVRAKIKHMIVLTDGQTSGQGYQALASQCHAEGITISTVAVGAGAQVGLLQAIAAAGGGQSYVTMDPTAITRIFTQDTMVHTGRMIREQAFEPQLVEPHPMLRNWDQTQVPPLLGYVKTNRKATAQVPLVTDKGDPLLAHWRFGLGKVTAFTSDCKSRWAPLWANQWPGYSQFWAQVLRETARAPQGQNMDLELHDEGEQVRLAVDLLEDAGTRRNAAEVEADIYFVPSHSLGASMRLLTTEALEQEGPGLYSGSFRPDDAGVYLIRARAGSQMVSAGYVHNPSAEVATGQVNEELLRKVCEMTGGQYLDKAGDVLTLEGSDVARYVELLPLLLKLALALLMVDISIRRWENVLGIAEQLKNVVK